MNKLYDYYDMKINLLCRAVICSNEEVIDSLLANENFTLINDGVSPLYFIDYVEPKDRALRIFRKILNNERFTNVNTVFYDGHYSSTLLNHLLYQEDPIYETCCVELINSPKYQLIDYPGNYGDSPNDLNTAIIQGKNQAAKAIMDHPDFTKIDFCFGGYKFVENCKKLYDLHTFEEDEIISDALQLIMSEYVQRKGREYYNATGTNIAKRLTYAIQILMPYVSNDLHYFPPLSAACNHHREDNSLILEIISHPKFSGEMLLRHINDVALRITDIDAYTFFQHNKKLEGWTPEFYGELAYYLINRGKVGLLKALIENENICFSEQFYSYYKYFLKNAIKASMRTPLILERRYGYDGDEICEMIEAKYKKQLDSQQLEVSKFVELAEEDYSILRAGMEKFYYLVYQKGKVCPKQSEINKTLKAKLNYDEQTDEIGPFFNLFDRDKVWKLFSEYQTFETFRKSIVTDKKH